MKPLLVVLAGLLTACTYGPNSSTWTSYNYPPVGYVLQAQPAPDPRTCPNPQYQTFWTYDSQGRFNPTQQYVCPPPVLTRGQYYIPRQDQQ